MRITPRHEWGAKFGRGDLDPGAESGVVIHHSYKPALSAFATEAEEKAACRSIERYHVETNGWLGIGYNFLVSPTGRVYEGRGWTYRGSHAGPMNASSIGVCLLINGTATEPNAVMVEAVRELIAEGLRLDEIEPVYRITGHRDHMARTCPGEKVYARLHEFRHDAGPEWPTPNVVAIPRPAPALNLQIIEIPRREHVHEIIRVRQLDRSDALPGIKVAEVLLRGVLAAHEGGRAAVLKLAADALADYVKERAA